MNNRISRDQMRAADTDREQVAEQLRTAHAEGRLDLTEYDQRLQQSWAARTMGELNTLTADLPQARAKVTRMVQRPVNGFAVASVLLGSLWFVWIGSILALTFGYIARGQINRRGERGAGMATAGIALGWVGVATLAITLYIVLFILTRETATPVVPAPPGPAG